MGCEAYNERLLDLFSEELSPAEERELRAHLEGCATCHASYLRLSATLRIANDLPIVTPRRELDAPLLAAARARVSKLEASPEPSTRGAWWETLRSILLGPQFAMATVMVLVVAFGLFAIPELRRDPPIAGRRMLEPEIEPAREQHAPEEIANDAPETFAQTAPEAERRAEGSGALGQAAPSRSKGDGSEQFAEMPRRSAPVPEAKKSVAKRAATAEPSMELALADDVSARGAGASAFPAAPPAARSAEKAGAAPPPSPAPGGRAEVAESSAPLSADATSEVATAHETARRRRAAGDLSGAYAAYRAVLAAGPSYPGRGEALLEAAEVLLRLDRPDDARRLLKEALGRPETAARARAMAERLPASP